VLVFCITYNVFMFQYAWDFLPNQIATFTYEIGAYSCYSQTGMCSSKTSCSSIFLVDSGDQLHVRSSRVVLKFLKILRLLQGKLDSCHVLVPSFIFLLIAAWQVVMITGILPAIWDQKKILQMEAIYIVSLESTR
jgi:hypothetical protein